MNRLELLLCESIKQGASDLHLSAGQLPFLRIDGELRSLPDPLFSAEILRQLLCDIMTADQREKFARQFALDFALSFQGKANFRVNVFLQHHGLAAVFRLIPVTIPSLACLRLPHLLKKLCGLRHGLILMTGSTGCGKSTTLAALVDRINSSEPRHILTIEDPIEFVHASKKSLINQREVNKHTPDFAAALRAALREDPDVILVGEMRDPETIRLALTGAETGHLVMATLHSSSAPRAITRIVDVFPASEKNMIRNMLAESLQAVLCQTLAPKTGGGRVAAFEIMLGTPAIRHLIRDEKTEQMQTVMQTGREYGMCTLDQSLQELLTEKLISLETRQKLSARLF